MSQMEGSICSLPRMISTSSPLSGILFFSVTKYHIADAELHSCLLQREYRMRYPDVTMSELDVTTAKWLTGFIAKDGKEKGVS